MRVARIGRTEIRVHAAWWGNLRERDNCEDLGIERTTELNCF